MDLSTGSFTTEKCRAIGDSSTATITGAKTSETTVENNALSLPKGMADYGQSVASYAQYAQDNNLPPEQVKADMERMVKGDLPKGADIIKAILSNNPGSDTVMALLDAKDAKDYALALLTSIPATTSAPAGKPSRRSRAGLAWRCRASWAAPSAPGKTCR